MDQREKISFKVSEHSKKFQEETIIPFWENRAMRHILLENMTKEWMDAYEAGIITEFMEQRAPGHAALDDKIYHRGFGDFKDRKSTRLNSSHANISYAVFCLK